MKTIESKKEELYRLCDKYRVDQLYVFGSVLTDRLQIVDFRNWVIRAYNNIDDSIVWAILKNHLPVLKSEAGRGLNDLNE